MFSLATLASAVALTSHNAKRARLRSDSSFVCDSAIILRGSSALYCCCAKAPYHSASEERLGLGESGVRPRVVPFWATPPCRMQAASRPNCRSQNFATAPHRHLTQTSFVNRCHALFSHAGDQNGVVSLGLAEWGFTR